MINYSHLAIIPAFTALYERLNLVVFEFSAKDEE
jgi:hypothetical protein